MNGGYLTLGAYFVNLTVGNPPVNFSVLVDTGSSNTALPSVDCKNCYNTTLYNPDSSSTSSPVLCDSPTCLKCNPDGQDSPCVFGNPYCSAARPTQCGFGITYGGGSSALYGSYQNELLCLGGSQEEGGLCTQSNLGMISDSIFFGSLGILGIASDFNACNPTCVPTIVDDMLSSSQISQNIIGMCLTGSNGGIMDLGFVDTSRFSGELVWVAQTMNRWYNMHVLDVSLNMGSETFSLGLPSYMYWTTNDVIGSFIDSGTSVILMGPAIYEAFATTFQTNFCHLPGVCTNETWFSGSCFPQSAVDPSKFPTLNFYVNSLDNQSFPLTVSPDIYLVPVEDVYCMGVTTAIGVGLVLGDVFLENYYAVYDRENVRLGFAPVLNCDA